MLEQIGEALISAEHREQIEALRAGILQIVQGFRGHHHKVTAAGADRPLAEMKDHLAPQYKEQLSSAVVMIFSKSRWISLGPLPRLKS